MYTPFTILCCILTTFLSPLAPRTGSIHTAASIRHERNYYEHEGTALWDAPVRKRWVALTFDDGPSPRVTEPILRLLHQYGDHATFFVIGDKIKKYPATAKLEIENGHEIGNHTFTHRRIDQLSTSELQKELQSTKDVVIQTTGFIPTCFRPPRGYYDDRIVDLARSNGYKVVIWSWDQDTRDWSSPGTHRIVRNVLGHLNPGDVILFHDSGGNRRQTIESLKLILPELHRRGYASVTISELIRESQFENRGLQK